MYTLTTEGKKLLTRGVTSHSKLELSDKEIFLFAYKEYKSVTKGSRPEVAKAIKLHIEAKTESVNVQRAVLRVVSTANKYVDMQVIANFDKLEYSNIKGLVNLFKYIDKEYSDKSKEVRETIKSLHTDDMSITRYNNLIVDNIKTLKEKYSVVATEDGDIIKVTYDSVLSNISKLSIEDKLRLLEELSNELSAEQAA